jgi:hypothetical protein
MSNPKVYEIYDATTNELLATGTAMECEKKLHLDSYLIRAVGRGAKTSKKYTVIQVSVDREKLETASNIDAAKQWDAFCEPIRRRFGIPVRRTTKEDEKHGRTKKL